jgi:uncharacterized membrane protein
MFNNYIDNQIKGNMNIPININAPVRSRNQIEIETPLDAVWQILTDIENWSKWQKSVSETIVFGEVEEGTQFNWKAGGVSFKSKIHTSKLKSKFGWTGTTMGASAIHNWTFEGKGNKTIVVVEESLQGIFPKLFRNYFQKNLDSGIVTNLNELKTAAESKIK